MSVHSGGVHTPVGGAWSWGVCLVPGGVPGPGGSAPRGPGPRGVLGPGGLLLGDAWSWGCLLWVGCAWSWGGGLLQGGAWSWEGVPGPGGSGPGG